MRYTFRLNFFKNPSHLKILKLKLNFTQFGTFKILRSKIKMKLITYRGSLMMALLLAFCALLVSIKPLHTRISKHRNCDLRCLLSLNFGVQRSKCEVAYFSSFSFMQVNQSTSTFSLG